MTEEQNNPTNDDTSPNDVYFMGGIENKMIGELDRVGTGLLMASHRGIDLAVKQYAMAPALISEKGDMMWPEAGIRINPKTLNGIFAYRDCLTEAGTVEFDFRHKPNGFSIGYIPGHSDTEKFNQLTNRYAVEAISSGELQKIRKSNAPTYNTCPCCKERREKIRNNTEQHPIYQILKSLSEQRIDTEFHMATDYLDMLCSWKIEGLKHLYGEIAAVGNDHLLRLDATLIHTIYVQAANHRKRPSSILRCFHSHGGMMLEIVVPENQHAQEWHDICSREGSY